VGLLLAGCDSNGSNGDDDPASAFEYPSTTYGEETVVNLIAFDLAVKTELADQNSEQTLLNLYTGNADDAAIRAAQGLDTQGQGVYSDIAAGVNVSALVSTQNLIRSSELEMGDSPSPGSAINTNELITYFLGRAGSEDLVRTDNGFVLNQFAEKMLLGTPIYGEGAAILADFADDGSVSGNAAEQWDAAFGYFGFPRSLEPFLDYANGTEGLAGGAAARDVDGNGSVDLTSEYIHTWASYAIERAAAAENNGQPNDFARDAFNALVEGREAIENGDDPSAQAQTALSAWEATVAVNVIHYNNSMRNALQSLDAGDVSNGDISEDAWGESKAFAWGLQFYSDQLSSAQLDTLHDLIGNDPPYGELTRSEYLEDLNEANALLQQAYGFNASNVEAW
jgi:hypothetical protein